MPARGPGFGRPVRVALATIGAVAGLAVAAASAWAAPGDLVFSQCFADEGRSGCHDPAHDSLDGAVAAAVSPDGASVYVVSRTAGSVTRFSRAADGHLAAPACIADDGAGGCTGTGAAPLGGASAIALSPDGASVYVASAFDDSLTHYARGAGGGLTFAGCIADDGAQGCRDLATDPLGGANALAVSPDGASLYVGAFDDDALVHFSRDATGRLTFEGCVADAGRAGCLNAPVDPLTDVTGLAVSPDGASLFATGAGDGSLAHYGLEDHGRPAFAWALPAPGYPTSVAISPDGASVYVVSNFDAAILHYSRDPLGQVLFQGCIADSGHGGCADPPHDSLGGAFDVTVSPDGEWVYVAAFRDDAVTWFARDAQGRLTERGCIADGGRAGCADPPLDSLFSASSVTASPDARSVYVTSFDDDAITVLTREQAAPGAAAALTCAGRPATIVAIRRETRGTRGPDVIVGRAGRDVIHGLSGDDIVCGRGGDDLLDGGPGADRLFGQAGADRLIGGAGIDRLRGGPGRDVRLP